LSAAAHGRFDPDRMERRIDRRVDRMLNRVDATEEQRDKVKGIFKSALADVKALGIKPGETHEKYIQLLRSDTVDPAAFEALRAQQMQTADAASKRIVQAFAEAAQVLTPDQRRQVADRMERRSHRHHRDRDENQTPNQNQAPAQPQSQGQNPDAPKQ
jgi:Spy/CpxP family protein refolding chaperone